MYLVSLVPFCHNHIFFPAIFIIFYIPFKPVLIWFLKLNSTDLLTPMQTL